MWATDRVDNATTAERGPFGTASLTKSYLFGGQRVAMPQGSAGYYLHGDHLGSVSMTTDTSGSILSQARYTPFGEALPWAGSGAAVTDFGFTGQRAERGMGLMDFNARFYAAHLGRFISADSMIPGAGNPRAWDRFSYGFNNPLRFTDPTGHIPCDLLPDEDRQACEEAKSNHDPVELDEWGEKMKKMYDDLKDEMGWESPLDFLYVMLAFELGDLYKYLEGNPGDEDRLVELLAHTAVHWMSWRSNCANKCSSADMSSKNMIFNFIGLSHSVRSRYSVWKGGGSPNFTVSAERGEMAAAILQKMQNAPGEWFTGGFSSNGHVSTWGNSRYPDKNGIWVNFWANQDKVDEFADIDADGFNLTGSSGHTVSFKWDNFAVLTADEAAYWTQP